MNVHRLLFSPSAPRSIYPAGFLEPARVAAPVAAAGVTVPLAHAFPLLAVGGDGQAKGDFFRLGGSWNAMNNADNRRRSAFGARGNFGCFHAGSSCELFYFLPV